MSSCKKVSDSVLYNDAFQMADELESWFPSYNMTRFSDMMRDIATELREVRSSSDLPQSAEIIRRTGDLTEADYDRAIGIMVRTKRASTSFLQRKIGLAYNAAAKLMERAEADGFVSKPDAVGKRHVAADPSEAAADNRLIVGFMLDCNTVGQVAASENLIRGIKAEASRRKLVGRSDVEASE